MLIDSYVHVGKPRYGSLRVVHSYLKRLKINKKVLVLGPDMPDFTSLFEERNKFPGETKIMGIPFGKTKEQREELTDWQIKEGIDGFRLMPSEVEPNRYSINRLGEEGLWLFAINPYQSVGYTAFLLEWLETYPLGKIASPHFLSPLTVEECSEDKVLFKRLLRHPRFNAIFSRSGGVGSTEEYPHKDLIPWVKGLIDIMGWEKLLWGGEMPIFYQRSEQPEMVRDWIKKLDVGANDDDFSLFYHKNSENLFFNQPGRSFEGYPCPAWVENQTDRNARVYLFPHNRLFLPMEDYEKLIFDYQNKSEKNGDISFADYVVDILKDYSSRL